MKERPDPYGLDASSSRAWDVTGVQPRTLQNYFPFSLKKVFIAELL